MNLYSFQHVALPSKPLALVALSDADSGSAMSFVKQKLHDANVDIDFSKDQTAYIERLGGRASDLESVRIVGLSRIPLG